MLSGKHLEAIPATPLAVGTIRTYGVGFLLYGLAVILQGPQRWSGPSYATVTAAADPWVWGLISAVLGLLTLVGSFRSRFAVRNIGLYGWVAYALIFAIALETTALLDDHVSFTGGIIYAIIAGSVVWVARAKEDPRARRP